eukprot:SAG11_NODE_13228_length_664_cov_2.499115_1_plen_48_part_01
MSVQYKSSLLSEGISRWKGMADTKSLGDCKFPWFIQHFKVTRYRGTAV